MGVRGGPYVTHQNQYLFLDLLLIALFKKVEVLYVVPGTLGSLSVPGEGLFFFFKLIEHCIQKMRSYLRLNTLEPMPRMLVRCAGEKIHPPHMPQAPDTLRYSSEL